MTMREDHPHPAPWSRIPPGNAAFPAPWPRRTTGGGIAAGVGCTAPELETPRDFAAKSEGRKGAEHSQVGTRPARPTPPKPNPKSLPKFDLRREDRVGGMTDTNSFPPIETGG